jgi:5'-nucleotidase
MRLLLSNDDGILARGLVALERAATPLGEVFVVAPDREQSATSHSLTMHHPLRPVQIAEHRWQVDGTPTDCVMLALEALLPERPDFVLSGVNHGPNMGEDVLYSGTVAAAMEGLALGVPAIAFSFAGSVLRADALLDDHVGTIERILRHITGLPVFPESTLFNVNIPPVAADQLKGFRLTRLGRRAYSDSLTRMKDPWGRPIYWIGGGSVDWKDSTADSDFQAIADGYVSITPLHLDLTHRAVLDSAELWWRPL